LDEWPPDRPVAQVSIEFEVADVQAVTAAAEELRLGGFELLQRRARSLGAKRSRASYRPRG
jgi:hypothetical protein